MSKVFSNGIYIPVGCTDCPEGNVLELPAGRFFACDRHKAKTLNFWDLRSSGIPCGYRKRQIMKSLALKKKEAEKMLR